jgi:hypothetical protein
MKKLHADSSGFSHILVVLLILLVVLLVMVGSLMFQRNSDTKYLADIKTPYNIQSAQMKLVYKSFSEPVFSSNNTTTQTDNTEVTFVNSLIKTAKSETYTLNVDNKLTILPYIQWVSSVSNVHKEHSAMQTYINNSNVFLSDYQTLGTYITGFDAIGDNQLNSLSNLFQNLSNNSNVSQLYADMYTDSQKATVYLSEAISAVKKLNPPTDLKQNNSQIINDLSELNADLQSLVEGVNNQNTQQFASAGLKLEQDSQTLNNLANANAGMLQKNLKQIHTQILNLEAENPLSY